MVKRLKSRSKSSKSTPAGALPATTKAQKQNQLIAYFATDQGLAVLAAPDLTVSDLERQDFLNALRDDKITPDRLAAFLRAVPLPDFSSQTVLDQAFQRIAKDPRTKQILAVASGYNAKNWEEVDAFAIRHLVGTPSRRQPDYRTPVDFVSFRNAFLEDIRSQATPEQLQDYETAFDTFESIVYGDRFTYYDVFRTFLRKVKGDTTDPSDTTDVTSNKPAANATSSSNTTSTSMQTTTPASSTDTPATAPSSHGTTLPVPPANAQINGLASVPAAHRDAILSRAVIEGDPWRQDGQEYRLSVQNLASAGLAPTYELSLGSTLIAFSPIFVLSSSRPAVIAYVVQGDQIKVRGYYRSRTEGIWHYLPDYIRGARGEGLGWFGEAYSPRSTTLPIAVQSALDQLYQSGTTLDITTINTDFLLASTAFAYDSQQAYRDALARGQMRGDFYREVDHSPINATANSRKSAPQLVSVNSEMLPDFQRRLGQFFSHSSFTGPFQCYAYGSYNGNYAWLFCCDDRGRSWVGSIDAASPITSSGCAAHWVAAGDIMTPLYEPSARASGYGDPTDARRGYVGMWNTYLSKIPLIQSFIAARSAS